MKKRIISLCLSICLLVGCLAVLPFSNTFANAQDKEEKPSSYYTPVNGYFYQLQGKMSDSVDSFEAWIKLPVLSGGGTIFTDYSSNFTWTVDLKGRFAFKWKGEAVHTFSETQNLADGQWHHVALVRTNNEFTYYLDGIVEGVHEEKTTKNTSPMTYNIGSANRYNHTLPLEGYIKQVTIYEGAISQERIQSDMQNANITEGDEQARLLGNWNVGNYWTERFVSSTVEGSPVAELYTFDKFMKADYSFGDYDYTFAIFPDIQIMTNYNEARLNNQIQWLVNKKEEMNVQFAMFVGDLSDFGQKEELYVRAANAMSRLDNKIPYCFVPGNHDYDNNAGTRDQVYFNRHFPYSKHTQLPGYGGSYQEGTMTNNYYTFDVGNGIKYLVINLEYKPRLSVLRWANVIAEAHPDHRIIMNTHSYLTNAGDFSGGANVEKEGNGGQTIFDEFMVNHPNIFMGVGGHENNDTAFHRYEYGKHGNKILSMLCDVQVSTYNGEGALDVFLLVHVNESKKTMTCLYYSPMHEKVFNLQGQFQLSFADPLNPTIGA